LTDEGDSFVEGGAPVARPRRAALKDRESGRCPGAGVKLRRRRFRAMTKADLVDIVANKTGLTKRDVAQVVEALLEAIKASLAQHRHIEIREFGTFKVKKRKASMKYNPRDRSQKVVVPEKMVPVFKPSKFLKERVNWSGQEAAPGDTAGPESGTGSSEEANV